MCANVCMAQQALNNDSIVRMHTSGLGDDVIVLAIQNQAGTYNTGTDGLIALKTAGLSDKIIGAMITKTASAAPAPTGPRTRAADCPGHGRVCSASGRAGPPRPTRRRSRRRPRLRGWLSSLTAEERR